MDTVQPSFSFYHLPSAIYYLISSFFCLSIFLTSPHGQSFLLWLLTPITLAISVSFFFLTFISMIKILACLPVNLSRILALVVLSLFLLFGMSIYSKFSPTLGVNPAWVAGLFLLCILAEGAATFPSGLPLSDKKSLLTTWQENVSARLIYPVLNFILAFLSAGISILSILRIPKKTMESNSLFGFLFASLLLILVAYTPFAGLIFALGYAKLSYDEWRGCARISPFSAPSLAYARQRRKK